MTTIFRNKDFNIEIGEIQMRTAFDTSNLMLR